MSPDVADAGSPGSPGSPGAGERGGPTARRIGLVAGPALFLFLLLAPGLPLDGPQRRAAAVTALTAVWWITLALPIGVTSLLPAVLFPLLFVMPAREAAPVYMSDLVMLFVGAFIIALGLERWGVHRRMALWIIARVGTSPRNLVLGFMAAAAFLSLWINNTATTLLMLPIGLAVIARLEEEEASGSPGSPESQGGQGRNKRFSVCLLLGIAYSASVGGMGTLVGTAPNQIFLGQFTERFADGPRISFGEWFVGWAPLVVLFVPIAWWLLTRVILPVTSRATVGDEVIREERRRLGPVTSGQVLMSVVFGLTALLWVTRADLDLGSLRIPGWSRPLLGPQAADPAWYALHKNDVSDSSVALVMAILCFLIPVREKTGGVTRTTYLMDWRTAVRLPWEILLMLGGGFCLARGFRVTELDQVLGEIVAPLFAELSPWMIVFLVALFVSFLTELTSNTATTAVLLPVMAQASVSSGLNPLIVMAPATIAASAAFMMPVATPPNAVVFSSRRIVPWVMARSGLLLNLVTVVLITLVFQLWVRLVWNIELEAPAWARD